MGALTQGTLTLFGAGLINRVLGFFYRILLAQRLGSQGMGLLGYAFPVLHVAITAATAGLPVAVSKIVAERAALNPGRVREVLRTSLRFVLVRSLVATVILALSLRFLENHVLADPRAVAPLTALMPLLTIVAVSSVLRGYFQGLQRMAPSAVGQVVEQIVRIGSALWLIDRFQHQGLAAMTVAAAGGMVLGELCGLLILWLAYLMRGGPAPTPLPPAVRDSTLRELLGQALPISVTRVIGSLTEFLDATIIPRRLVVSGLTRDAATAFYGNLGGMAMPLVFFPTVISYALSQALVPAVSDAYARQDLALVRRRIAQSIYIALVVAVPTSAVFIVFGHLLGILFYGQRQVGDLLVPLAFAAPFVYLEASVSAVLRGLGRAALAMTNGLLGSAVRLVLVWTLTPLPGFGIRAVLLAIGVDLFISFWLNYRSLCRVTGYAADLRRLVVPPLVAGLVLFFSLRMWEGLLMRLGATLWVSTLAAIGLGALLYAVLLLALGGGRRNFSTL